MRAIRICVRTCVITALSMCAMAPIAQATLIGTVATAPGVTVVPGLVPTGAASGTLVASLTSPFTSTLGTTAGTIVSAAPDLLVSVSQTDVSVVAANDPVLREIASSSDVAMFSSDDVASISNVGLIRSLSVGGGGSDVPEPLTAVIVSLGLLLITCLRRLLLRQTYSD